MARYRDMNTGAEREISGRAPGYPWQLTGEGAPTGSKRARSTAKARQRARTVKTSPAPTTTEGGS